jgi:ADP-ribosylglycohydrolase
VAYNSLLWLIDAELPQAQEEGRDVGALPARWAELKSRQPAPSEAELEAFYQEILALPAPAERPYHEPSELEAIQVARPHGPRYLDLPITDAELADRIRAAWLGRAAGCILGKPVEGWSRAEIVRYLRAAGAWPLSDYIPYLPPEQAPHGSFPMEPFLDSCKGHITRVQRDDDIDYTILGLHILERFGRAFTTADVGQAWLELLPYGRVYTAERVAYKNLILGLKPPETATHRNPYREWIGAQIRADIFGYANPGQPEVAAAMAFRDAALSHTANGIYGAMFVAAAIAAAFATRDLESVIRTALSEIPAQCRTAEMIRDVLAWREVEPSWEGAWERLNGKWGALSRVHTINNLGLVLLGLLYGEGDFTRTICLAVEGGWDTDCNGATAGSIFGAMHGTAAIPPRWTAPLADRVETWVVGFGEPRLSELAARTMAVVRRA